MPEERKWYRIAEVADMLNATKPTIYNYINRGWLKKTRVGGKTLVSGDLTKIISSRPLHTNYPRQEVKGVVIPEIYLEENREYTAEQAAEVLKISIKTLYLFVKQLKLDAVKIKNRWVFTSANINQFVKNHNKKEEKCSK